jgi:hypothetical protein
MVLVLSRTYFPCGTNGVLRCADQIICHTIELPWHHNERRISCIAEGSYAIRKRYSTKFKWHLEIQGVIDRKCILIHPANNALLELKGCIAPVTELTGAGVGLRSRNAYYKLLAAVYKVLDRDEAVTLVVQS